MALKYYNQVESYFMTKLWVFQTNKQAYLDDCRIFQVYGVENPAKLKLGSVAEGGLVLLRLQLKNNHKCGHLGPYYASSIQKNAGDGGIL